MSSNGPPWGKANHFSVYERLFPFQSTWKVMIFIKQKQQLCTCITLLGAFLWCPEHEIPIARARPFQFSVTQGTEIKLNLVFVRTGRSASVQLWNIISPKTLVLGLAPGGGGGGGVLPTMAYTERLHQKGVPFSGLRYTEGYGFYSLKNSKG